MININIGSLFSFISIINAFVVVYSIGKKNINYSLANCIFSSALATYNLCVGNHILSFLWFLNIITSIYVFNNLKKLLILEAESNQLNKVIK